MGKKILVAEDSPTVLMMLKMALSRAGFEVLTSMDGVEALTKARTLSPDLVVLDCILPKLDGYNICRMLKSDPQSKDIPILMFTARTGANDKMMGEKTGADEYIPKSSNIEEMDFLIGRIHFHLSK